MENSITIVWDKSINDGSGSNDVIKYRVYRKEGDSAEWKNIQEINVKDPANKKDVYEYNDSSVDLPKEFKYSYYVDALNDENNFEKSDKILIVSKDPEDLKSPPPLKEGEYYVSSPDQEKLRV